MSAAYSNVRYICSDFATKLLYGLKLRLFSMGVLLLRLSSKTFEEFSVQGLSSQFSCQFYFIILYIYFFYLSFLHYTDRSQVAIGIYPRGCVDRLLWFIMIYYLVPKKYGFWRWEQQTPLSEHGDCPTQRVTQAVPEPLSQLSMLSSVTTSVLSSST